MTDPYHMNRSQIEAQLTYYRDRSTLLDKTLAFMADTAADQRDLIAALRRDIEQTRGINHELRRDMAGTERSLKLVVDELHECQHQLFMLRDKHGIHTPNCNCMECMTARTLPTA